MQEYTSPDYGTVEYDGFMYKLFSDVNTSVIREICGEIECLRVTLLFEHGHTAKYRITNNRIYLDELTVCVSESDAVRLASNPRYKPTVEKKRGINAAPSTGCFDYAQVKYSDLGFPLSISATVVTRQVYFDEHYNVNKHTHEEESLFVFDGGELRHEISRIQKSPARRVDAYAWDESYRGQIDIDRKTPRGYILDPQGSIEQYSFLLSVIVNYKNNKRISDALIDELFSFGKAFFCIKVMRETAPRSGEFVLDTTTYNLVLDALELRDARLLKRLLPHLDADDYGDVMDEILNLVETAD